MAKKRASGMTAHELLSDPSKWTCGALARNKNGEPTDVFDKNATCWCALGAVAYVHGIRDHHMFGVYIDKISAKSQELFGDCVVYVNDILQDREKVVHVLKELGL